MRLRPGFRCMRPAAPLLLALALLAPAVLAFGPGAYDLAAVKAQLERGLPVADWAFLPDHATPRATWSIDVPDGFAVAFDPGAGTVAVVPPFMGEETDAGCVDGAGAFAVWMPTPPTTYPGCQGYYRHEGPITELTLACAGALPGFGCAIVGIDYPQNEYLVFLCGFPQSPAGGGVEWPDQDLHLSCAHYGVDGSDWTSWAATLSSNSIGLTAGYLTYG